MTKKKFIELDMEAKAELFASFLEENDGLKEAFLNKFCPGRKLTDFRAFITAKINQLVTVEEPYAVFLQAFFWVTDSEKIYWRVATNMWIDKLQETCRFTKQELEKMNNFKEDATAYIEKNSKRQ